MKLELHYKRPGDESLKIGIADSTDSDLDIIKAVQAFIAIESEIDDFKVFRYSDRIVVNQNEVTP